MLLSTIIVIIVLFLLSAFFSSAETAYFNLKKHRENIPDKVKNLLKNPPKKISERFSQKPSQKLFQNRGGLRELIPGFFVHFSRFLSKFVDISLIFDENTPI